MAGGMNVHRGLAAPGSGWVLYAVAWLSGLVLAQATASERSLSALWIVEDRVYQLSGPNTFCYKNILVPGWREIWTRLRIRVNSSQEFKVKELEDATQLYNPGVWGWFTEVVALMLKEKVNETHINVDLFSHKTCFKVEPNDRASLYDVLLARRFDPQLIVVFVCGLLLFFYAESLSRSQLFFYTSGISVGILASVIIVIFILSRFMPKKGSLYLVLAGGWSLSLYLIQATLRNLQFLLREHWQYVMGYVTVSGLLSFAVCYKYGPLKEERSINLLNWGLQLLGLGLMYCGIQVRQVALVMAAVALGTKHLELPVRWTIMAYKRVRRIGFKPQPPALLTEEEYRQQGEVETQRALEELRGYCSSPEINAWKTVSRLSAPKRFADFVEGQTHLNPNEISVHEQEYGLGGTYIEEQIFDSEGED